MNTNGTGYGAVHDFTPLSSTFPSTNSDGVFPNGGLLLLNGVLYGAAAQGGPTGSGLLFSLTPSVALLPPSVSGGYVLLSFQTLAGLSYTLQQNTNLSGTNWISYTNLIGNGSVTQFARPNAYPAQLFFRVRQP